MLKIQHYHHKNKLHFGIYFNSKELFEIVIIFYDITNFTACLIQLMLRW